MSQQLSSPSTTASLQGSAPKRGEENTSRAARSATSANKRKRDVADHDGTVASTRRSALLKSPSDSESTKLRTTTDHGDATGNTFSVPAAINSHESQAAGAAAATGTGKTEMQNPSGALDYSLQAHDSANSISGGGRQNGGGGRGAGGQRGEHQATSTAAAALGLYPPLNVPQSTEMSFASTVSVDPDSTFGMDGAGTGGENEDEEGASYTMDTGNDGGQSGASTGKARVGSEEWHRVRRLNHKNVERRRRETINEGINELAKIVPGCEKNKGAIVQNSVSFIKTLKENEATNIEKWTLEKILTEQAIAELSTSNGKLKTELERAWAAVETYKKRCEKAGVKIDDIDDDDDEEGEEMDEGGAK